MSTLLADDQAKCSHTPGPWKAVLHFGQWAVRQDPVNWDGMGYQSIGHVGRFHADRKGTHYGDMFKANAHLIAAAPELLQGMKDLYRAYVNLLEAGRDRIATYGGQCDSVETMERGDPWLKKARDVVAKAEGRSCA